MSGFTREGTLAASIYTVRLRSFPLQSTRRTNAIFCLIGDESAAAAVHVKEANIVPLAL